MLERMRNSEQFLCVMMKLTGDIRRHKAEVHRRHTCRSCHITVRKMAEWDVHVPTAFSTAAVTNITILLLQRIQSLQLL